MLYYLWVGKTDHDKEIFSIWIQMYLINLRDEMGRAVRFQEIHG